MYDVKSLKAEEFISDEEIKETLAYADANKDNMEVLAFIYNYGYSYANREVDNCVRLKLKDAKSEITGILPATGTHAATIVARYDLMGRPVTEATKGVQLIRLSDGTVQKVVNR